MRQLLFPFFFLLAGWLLAQNPQKQTMDPSVFDSWLSIEQNNISNDGQWVSYVLAKEEGDHQQCLYDIRQNQTYTFERGKAGKLSADNRFLVFLIYPPVTDVKEMRRKKVEKEKLPHPTLAIYDLEQKRLDTIPGVSRFSLPQKWAGSLVYQMAPTPQDYSLPDSLQAKKENEENGHQLVIRDLQSKEEVRMPYVLEYHLAEEAPRLLLSSSGDEQAFPSGVYYYDCKKGKRQALYTGPGHFKKLCLSKMGDQAAFLVNPDTSKQQFRPYELYHWNNKKSPALMIADTDASFIPQQWHISENGRLHFSENEQKLFFGIAPAPLLADTSLLKEEIVQVEIWHYQDKRTYPQQKKQLERDRKKTYPVVYHLRGKKFVSLASPEIPSIKLGDEGNAAYALGEQEEPYLEKISWEGFPNYKDLYWINLDNGEKREIGQAIRANPQASPAGNYALWYSTPDSSWMLCAAGNNQIRNLSKAIATPFFDELNDRPMYPSSYGIAGWLENDQVVLLYDRYDIWQVDPSGQQKAKRLTTGRENETTFRYIRTDSEERFIDSQKQALIHAHNQKDKSESYYFLDWASGKMTLALSGDFALTRRVKKAEDSEDYLFTKQSFQLFPDLQYAAKGNFKNAKKVSSANPQQKDYSWGSIELYNWTASDGQQIQGMLAKPENFDPNKKYPLLVNFYERSSNRLHSHRAPYPHRSTINYTYYLNKGYVIFNPDVPYRVGYPGESAENAVLSGITSLIGEGFINAERIGVQGHSWGGYQVAHLLTKTDIFRCAESGAPVVNMFSAYGGIRWGSGLSRMFQYEHTQSRIGGTIWEYPLRYLENSPLFTLDKVNTPVLILHNDHDGAVPWYQGIEYFMGLRRLGKPAWLLNYNGEPHWPLKRQNRLDFNLRMEQFFDYYLLDAPLPRWMESGVPAVEQGILRGLER